jgi:hypothetical protein
MARAAAGTVFFKPLAHKPAISPVMLRAQVAHARAPTAAVAIVLALGGCRAEETREPVVSASVSQRDQPTVDAKPSTETSSESQPEPVEIVEREPYTPASTLGAAIELRKATGTKAVYAEPTFEAPLRGRILRGDTFHVYAHREGPDCKRDWAQVAEGGWICLERTEPDDAEPRSLPVLAADALLPFVYVRHREHKDAKTPAIPVYSSVSAFNRGEAPIDSLPAYGSWAFVRSQYNRGARVYLTEGRRAVPAEQLLEFKPSEFAGEQLDTSTIPPGATLAWAVRWKTLIHETADPESAVVGRVGYHEPLFVKDNEGVRGSDKERWFEVIGPEGEGGWISDDDIQRFLPVAPPTPIFGGQITVDIDLDEQVLSVWREEVPVFATLISSGKPGDSTPVGLYRIETKWAYSKMESLASAEDPYYVDAVPWAMYFDGRYALHAAYWHDLFGHRLSHGCVNLSPRDAKRVFDLVTPTLPAGWLVVHEHARDPGALVRVRNGKSAVPDRRKPLDPQAPSAGG